MLVFENELLEGYTPKGHATQMLTGRLLEALPIPIVDTWGESLWAAGVKKYLIGELLISGDCSADFAVNVIVTGWTDIPSGLVKEGTVDIC